jgi:hypothetical protein
VPPEDGRLTPETRRGLRHNKVFVKVYQFYTINVLVQQSEGQQNKNIGKYTDAIHDHTLYFVCPDLSLRYVNLPTGYGGS